MRNLCLQAQLLYRRDPAFMLELGRLGRPALGAGPGARLMLFLHDPEAIHTLLTRHHDALAKGGGHRRAAAWLGASVLVAEGEEHRALRRRAQPAFARARMAGYAHLIAAATEGQIAAWRPGEAREIVREMRALATAAVAAAFAGPCGQAEVAAIDAALEVVTPAFSARAWPWTPLAERLEGTPAWRLRAARARLDELVYGLVDRAAAAGSPPALIAGAGRREARDALATILLAGRETTAALLSWVWQILAADPGAEAALHAELGRELGGRRPQWDDLPRLAHTRRLIAEALRLYPPAWATARRALAPIDLGAIRIPAGTVLLFSQLALHRDGRWFAEPGRCAPERWAAEGAGAPRGAYLPFGAGPRRCLGEQFALAEAAIAVATIASRWRLRPLRGGPPGLQGGPALMPAGGLPMRLEPRAAG